MYHYSYAAAFLLGHFALSQGMVVDLGSGTTVQGTLASNTNVESFLNTRFGVSTAGSNHFAPPKAYTYSSGSAINASQPGSACPQQKVPLTELPIFENVTDISEDCLTLRVDRPANMPSNAKLPVMAFIYGSGDSVGQIFDTIYDPKMLISGSASNGVPIIYMGLLARSGDPSQGSATLQGWPTVNPFESMYDVLVLGGPDNGTRSIGNGGSYDEYLAARCAFWNSRDVLAQLHV